MNVIPIVPVCAERASGGPCAEASAQVSPDGYGCSLLHTLCCELLHENSERGPHAAVTVPTYTQRLPGGIHETDDCSVLCRPAQRRPDVRYRPRPAGSRGRPRAAPGHRPGQIGRASCRERVEMSVGAVAV